MCESELVCSEQVFTEFLAEVYRYLSTSAMALHEVEEVFVYNVPFLVLSSTFLLIVGEEIAFYGAQNEAYMSRSAEKLVRGLCFNELGVGG